jgi:hypothetical protein
MADREIPDARIGTTTPDAGKVRTTAADALPMPHAVKWLSDDDRPHAALETLLVVMGWPRTNQVVLF